MSPNQKQITASNIIKLQALFFESTNDINSPTHASDINETINSSLCDCFNDDEKDEFKCLLIDLLIFIRGL
jgi:hypothetical protein